MLLDEAIAQALPLPAVYVVGPLNGAFLYKGSARNLQERLKDHRAGRATRTRNHRPLRLFYHEYCSDYSVAQQRERFLKSGAGRAWLRDHLTPSAGQTVPSQADPPPAGNLLGYAFGGSPPEADAMQNPPPTIPPFPPTLFLALP